MPDSQSDPIQLGHGDDVGRQLSLIHNLVASDNTPDPRQYRRLTNRQKIEAICKVTGVKPEAFEITDPQPFQRWFTSLETDKLLAGFYASDLQMQFQELVLKKIDQGHAIHQAYATAEYWYNKFAEVFSVSSTGAPHRKHTLH